MPKINKTKSNTGSLLTSVEKDLAIELRRLGKYRFEISEEIKCSRKCLEKSLIADAEFNERFKIASESSFDCRAEEQILRVRELAQNPPKYTDSAGQERVDPAHLQAYKLVADTERFFYNSDLQRAGLDGSKKLNLSTSENASEIVVKLELSDKK
jgi:hypothetical protein